jgi:hypothetical protein
MNIFSALAAFARAFHSSSFTHSHRYRVYVGAPTRRVNSLYAAVKMRKIFIPLESPKIRINTREAKKTFDIYMIFKLALIAPFVGICLRFNPFQNSIVVWVGLGLEVWS